MAGGFSIRIFLPDGSPDGLPIGNSRHASGTGHFRTLLCFIHLFIYSKQPRYQGPLFSNN